MNNKERYIRHYGIPGMKWGKRKIQDAYSSVKGRIKKHVEDSGEKKWEKKAMSNETYVKAYNKTAAHMNSVVIPKINNDPRYKDKNFNDPKNAKLYKKYMDEYASEFGKSFSSNFTSVAGKSPYQNREVVVSIDKDTGLMAFSFSELRQEALPEVFYAKLDSNGFVIDFVETDENGELKHYGILGMRWGRRKGSDSDSGSSSQKPQKKKTSEMTNQELREKIERANLERQYKEISKNKSTDAGRKFVTEVLRESAKNTAVKYVTKAMGAGVEMLLAKLNEKRS